MADRQYVIQQGRPAVDKAFNGLRTITRISHVSATGTKAADIEAQVFLDYGTADPEFTLALLVKRGMSQLSVQDNAYLMQLTEVYQEFTTGEKVSVGEDQHFKLEDGRYGFVRRYVALASEAEGLAAAIGDLVSSQACQDVKINKQGVGAEIVETYISAGILAETTEYSNNGALETRSITYFNGTPSTPAGFTLTGTSEQNPNGLPGRTYRFAKGEGQISYDPSSENNGNLLKVRIRHLTAPGASNPISTPVGYVLTSGPTYQEADGHMIWAAGFAKGLGEISRRTEYNQSDDQGTTGVTVVSVTHLTAPGSGDPVSSPGAGYEKISSVPEEADGHRIWRVVYAKGTGLVAQMISARQDGLREVTNISLGTRVAPDGIIIRDDYRIGEGYKIYTVTTMQTAAGGADPTVATMVFERYVPFTYPGRAKAFSETYNSRKMLDVFRSPPVTTDVKGVITVTYTTSNAIGTVSDYWNPSEWATLRAQWIGVGDEPQNLVMALPGYRSVSSTPVTETCSAVAPNDVSCMGNIVFGNTTAKITVTGGPADPGGSTFTLDVNIEPAFTGTDGTKYYRKTVVTAAIPAQDALPV